MTRRVLPAARDWAGMRRDFAWDVPPGFTIFESCCDSWARAEPDRRALIDVGADGALRHYTYGQLKDASDRLATAMAARGLGRGDRVAVYLPQGPEVLITHFAVMKLGAISLPLFTLFGPDAIEYRLRDCGARMLVTDAPNLDKITALRDRLPELTDIYCTSPAPEPVRDFHADIAAAAPLAQPATVGAEDPAVMIYSSGTTGDAKGALHAHRFLVGHLPSIELHHDFFPQPGDVGWTPADWAWIGGLLDMALPCLHYGVPLVSHRMRKFDPDAAYRLIAAQGVRNLFLPPTALRLMRQATVPAGVAIRSIGSGGESLGDDVLAWGRETLGAPINEFYGQTECNLVVTSCASLFAPRPGAMGRATPGVEVAVIGADDAEVADGALGEIAVRGTPPAMFLRYWNRPAQTAAKFTGGWMRTGDLGRRDADGYFTFVARDDDVITSSGYRVGPAEIENCLTGHSAIALAACVGVPDPVRTEVVHAFVVLREGAAWSDDLAAELTALVRERVGAHVAPRRITPRDSLPMTATGKIIRRALREP